MSFQTPIYNSLIRIDSNDRTSGDANRFSIQVGSQGGIIATSKVVLKSAIIPNVFYNIRTGIDDVLVFTQSGQAQTSVTITEGFWNVSDLMTQLKTAMDLVLVGVTVAVTQNDQTKKITFTMSAGTIIITNSATSNLADSIGFQTTSADAAAPTGDSIPRLGGLSEVFIISDQLAPQHLLEDNSVRNVLASIPITSSFNASTVYEANDEELNSVNYPVFRNVSTIDIRLEDRSGNLVDLNGHSIKLMLMAYHEK